MDPDEVAIKASGGKADTKGSSKGKNAHRRDYKAWILGGSLQGMNIQKIPGKTNKEGQHHSNGNHEISILKAMAWKL